MKNTTNISKNENLGELLQSLVITSDPQYGWTTCTDHVDCNPYGYNGGSCQSCRSLDCPNESGFLEKKILQH